MIAECFSHFFVIDKTLEQELDTVPPVPNDYFINEIDTSFVFVNEASIEKEISDE